MADQVISRVKVAAGPGFAARISLAIMAVVTLVSVVTLFVSRQRVETAYLDQASRLAQSQFEYFGKLQNARLQEVRRRMRAYKEGAEGVRLRAAMSALHEAAAANEKDETGVAEVYEVVEEGLKSFRGTAGAVDQEAEGGALFYRLIDSKGQVLEPPAEVDAGLKSSTEVRAALVESLSRLKQELTNSGPMEVGYLPVKNAAGARVVVEVVSTRIVDTFNDLTTYLGTLIVGFPVPAAEFKSGGGSAALWVDGSFFPSDSFPWNQPDAAGQLTRFFGQEGSTGQESILLGGTPHRFSFRRLPVPAVFPAAYQVSAFSMAEALAAQSTLQSRILGVAALGLLLGLGLSLVLSHGLAVPIRRLAAATHDILEGRLNIRLPVTSRDEVGVLTASFNEMAEGLELKERYHNVLNQVADKQVAAELMSGKVTLGGETREVSVIFCDIRGFTALTEHMPPDEVIAMLNEHMTALTRVVHQHHGVVDKFVGDLIMAIFGAPRSYGEDAALAARCALQMIAERQALNAVSKYRIEMGIGLATGPVVAGCMGSNDRLNYTVLGERVNLASRLCSKAGRMEVVIDRTTRDALGAQAQVADLEPLALKGFAQPVPAYKLLGVPPNKA